MIVIASSSAVHALPFSLQRFQQLAPELDLNANKTSCVVFESVNIDTRKKNNDEKEKNPVLSH